LNLPVKYRRKTAKNLQADSFLYIFILLSFDMAFFLFLATIQQLAVGPVE